MLSVQMQETRGYEQFRSQQSLSMLNYFLVFYRRQKHSLSSRHKSRSPTPRRHKSRSPTPKRNERQRKRSTSSSPLSASPLTGTKEMKDATVKLKTEEEDKKRYNTFIIFSLLYSPPHMILCTILCELFLTLNFHNLFIIM